MSTTPTMAPSRQEPLAVLRDVRFSHDGGDSWVLDGIDLDVSAGERICLTGPNGAGKSTLARLIAGLAAPDSGTITLLDQHVFEDGTAYADRYRKARRGIGIVFQNPADQLITTVTADDTAFGPENLNLDRATITSRVSQALDAVDMDGFAAADPTRLSGGQQQRVALAGTLAMSPRLIVLDEPTAMLDAQAQRDVMAIIARLQAQGTAIVHVTHKTEELEGADRVLLLEDGRLSQIDTVQAIAQRDRSDSDRQQQESKRVQAVMHESKPTEEPSGSVVPSRTPSRKTAGADQFAGSPIIAVDHVSRRYSEAARDAIHDFSMSIEQGETVALMGRNGTGKTTLTRLLAALDKPSEGTITIAGLDLSNMRKKDKRSLRRTVGLVMQQPERQLFADTVLEDVAYGPKNQGLGVEEANAAAMRALDLLGIADLADRSPFSLSGGQQRLAAIAGIIAVDPPILIMDEPCAGLDLAASSRIDALIETLHARGITIVLVTHSIEQARRVADRIITLPERPGTHGADLATEATSTTPTRQNKRFPSGESYITSLDPRVKLVTFIVLLFTGFTVATPWQLALAAAMVLAITLASRMNPLKLIASLKIFLSMFVALGLINMFFVHAGHTLVALGPIRITDAGIYDAILYSCRLALVVLLGTIMLRTTTPTKLTDGFGSLLSPLHHLGLHAQEIALVMSLALRFLPTLASEARSIVDAQSARGGSIETGTPSARLKALAAIIVPVFTGALRHSDNLALALDARCYEADIQRTRWHVMKVGGRDYAFIVMCALYLVVLMLLGRGAGIIWT